MKTSFKPTLSRNFVALALLYFAFMTGAMAQTAKYTIYMDLAHGPKFWNDPSDMDGMDQNMVQRVRYMTDEILKNASKVDAELRYFKKEISSDQLKDCDLLFIHIPSAQYNQEEVKAVRDYLRNGGALFLVMDVDYWSTLAQTNVNDLIAPFDIQYGTNSPDTLSGGYTKAGLITKQPLKVTYHGGRIVMGGTPFCFNKQTEAYPFGTFKELKNGGKLIIMGDGMVSLYMTSWEGINDYQCSEFMHDAFSWLMQ